MTKNLFFALEIHAPWPETFPPGRPITEKHLTLLFLGEEKLKNFLKFPPLFPIGLVGFFDKLLFLPPFHPKVAAWHVHWLSSSDILLHFRKEVLKWLKDQGIIIPDKRPFLSHVTIARSPSHRDEWKKNFSPLPLWASTLHLYESQGHSEYNSLWKKPLLAPFEELEHTADIAFLIRGQSLYDIYIHAFIAICFSFPACLSYFKQDFFPHSLEEIIMTLNQIIAKVDGETGTPFKSVSYHGKIETNEFLNWEMIIDV